MAKKTNYGKSAARVHDLRSALEVLADIPGALVATDVEIDPDSELSGVYRHVGAGGTTMRPTRVGPAMLFNRIKGYPDMRVVIGVLASRERVAHMLGCEPRRLGFLLKEAVNHAIAPVAFTGKQAPCQEVVHKASSPDFDIRKLLPAPTNTPEDAGPYFTMGLCYAADPATGAHDVTIHRLCVQSRDELSMWLTPGRHIEEFRKKAEAAGKPLPISISIGVDPAIQVASCFEPPTTPLGFDELSIAGALRQRPVEMVNCLSVPGIRAIAHAEVVIEGELLPNVRVREDQNTNTGKAMPEFPGYSGEAKDALPVIKVRAITHRKNPILQTTIGSSEEHVSLAGIPTEASILEMVERAMPGRVLNVYAHSSGGGKLLAVMQFKKSAPTDEGRQRQAALLAFAAFSELKHVILVDEDVDPFDTDDVLWAMQTRYQGDVDTVFIPSVRCHPLDPSQIPEFSAGIHYPGMSCKTIFDCTVPFHLKDRFIRSQFKAVDVKKFLPDFEM